ncbi:MAG: pyridoxal phosphate-dependent aminotransferase [Candidatus Cloacimonetes bacterium]|nr:pyridoxal phosphate-dependent aminotransferase [Candidatus Cloacimonadota bacterium]
MSISERVKKLKPSATIATATKAKEMQAKGIDVINFGVGEPDFPTPEYIKSAAKKAIDENYTHYTATAGMLELRNAICEKFKKDNNLEYKPKNIMVSSGAKNCIMNILLAICNYKDEVLLPIPYWVSYLSQIIMADAIPKLVKPEKSNFKISAKNIEKNISPKVKAIIINSPNNPTGIVYSRKELEKIAKLAVRYDLIVISDEIYERLIYDKTEHISIASLPEMKNRTIVINGVSKAYAMTGWRLGYAAGPKEIINSALKIQGHSTSCANSITQRAVITALLEEDDSVEKMRREFEKRRNFLIEKLNSISNIKCAVPKGAFYAMPDISYYLKQNKKGVKTSVDLCDFLLENYHIALVAGSAFGIEGFVRFSYANSMKNIKEGVKRFEKGLKDLL